MNTLKKTKKKEEPKARAVHPAGKALISHATLSILKKPWTSERAHDIQAMSQYVFSVDLHATKPMVKKEVERRYGVTVLAVRVVNIKGKVKRYRNRTSRRTGLRKAIVTLKKGDTIDMQ